MSVAESSVAGTVARRKIHKADVIPPTDPPKKKPKKASKKKPRKPGHVAGVDAGWVGTIKGLFTGEALLAVGTVVLVIFVFLVPRLRRGKRNTPQAATPTDSAPQSGPNKASPAGQGGKLFGRVRFLSRLRKNPSRGEPAETSLAPKQHSSSEPAEEELAATPGDVLQEAGGASEEDAVPEVGDASEENDGSEEDGRSEKVEPSAAAPVADEVKSPSPTEEAARPEASPISEPSEEVPHDSEPPASESRPQREREPGTVVIPRSPAAIEAEAGNRVPFEELLLDDEPHQRQLSPVVRALLEQRLAEWSAEGSDESPPEPESEETEVASENESTSVPVS